jgi:hypothetical protein
MAHWQVCQPASLPACQPASLPAMPLFIATSHQKILNNKTKTNSLNSTKFDPKNKPIRTFIN